ncbi:MAG: hypothetical protein H0W50_11405 [Parachlamydiaceae bacterium]|nr:hypothetical protein [Parachlamydiaceae bacterium]
MLIYGTKTIDFKTIDLPVACSECGHDHQLLQIYRKFFSLYCMPLIPLRKKGIVICPSCNRELKKKSFFKELGSKGLDPAQAKLHFESLLKATKTPLYMYALPMLILAFVIGVFAYASYESHLNKAQAKAYLQNPTDNALIIAKLENDTHSYQVMYIPEIRNQKALIFDWKYGYDSLGDAKKGLDLALQSIQNKKIKANFLEPIVTSVENFPMVEFVYVHILDKRVDWEESFFENSNEVNKE